MLLNFRGSVQCVMNEKKEEFAHVVIITHPAVFYLRKFYVSISFLCVCFDSTNCFDLYCEQLLKNWKNEKQRGDFERKSCSISFLLRGHDQRSVILST